MLCGARFVVVRSLLPPLHSLYPSGMTLRSSLLVFGTGTALAAAAFLLLLLTVPPETAGALGESFFFSALFLGVTGLLTMCGILGRRRASRLLPALHIGPAFRQGFLLASAGVGLLLLQRFRVLRWWNLLLVVGVVVALDIVLTRGGEAARAARDTPR